MHESTLHAATRVRRGPRNLKIAVRTIITFCWCAMFVFALPGWADTIVLKSGTRIVVDSVKERNGRVEYTIGDNTLTIPKSIVARIESGAPASTSSGARSGSQFSPLELPPMTESMEISEELLGRVIHNGQVDTAALRQLEQRGNTQETAAAFAIAARFEESKNNLTGAAGYLESALHFLPNHPVLLEDYASVLMKLGKYPEGLHYAEQATRANAESAMAFAILGYALYKNDRNREALTALKKSLSLNQNDKVQQLLDHVERESKTEAEFHQQESSHFTLRYEGTQTNDALRQQILDSLEDSYRQIQNDLGASPRNIYVSLYTDQAFFDVTQAPAWSAALNDGKIRIPISGVKSVTPELARVLRHELTHSFVAQIAHGRAPQWLNEGIAELEQGASTSSFGPRLSSVYSSGHQVPLNMLEGNFDTLDHSEALVAYAESLATVEYIRATYGMADVARILQRLGEGQPIEAALRSTVHGGYKELDSEITEYLKRNYGN